MRFLLTKVLSDGREIILFARGEDKKRYKFRVTDFYPYFYSKRILQSNDVVRIEKGFKTLFGEEMYKIYVKHPGLVPKLREDDDYEADIPYIRRFVVDVGLRDYFELPDHVLQNKNENGEIIISYEDIAV